MSKQRPTSDRVANELMGASAFFKPTPPPPNELPQPPTEELEKALAQPKPERDVTTSRRHDASASLTTESPRFDINRETTSRDSLRLSIDETKALDALRTSLKWDHDLVVSKNDICRVALHALIEDFQTSQAKADGVRRLQKKQSKR